jgi:arylsulfatase A
LISLIDLPATAAALVGAKLSAETAPDSFDLLPTLLGKPNPHLRDYLVLMSGKGDLAIRQGKWKYIPDLSTVDGWKSWNKKTNNAPAKAGLFNLELDPGETKNLAQQEAEISKRLAGLLEKARSTPSTRPL